MMAKELDVRRFVQRSNENPDQCGLSELLLRHGITLSVVHRDRDKDTTELPTPNGPLVIHWEQKVVAPPVGGECIH